MTTPTAHSRYCESLYKAKGVGFENRDDRYGSHLVFSRLYLTSELSEILAFQRASTLNSVGNFTLNSLENDRHRGGVNPFG
jgi:hypothetical protein